MKTDHCATRPNNGLGPVRLADTHPAPYRAALLRAPTITTATKRELYVDWMLTV